MALTERIELALQNGDNAISYIRARGSRKLRQGLCNETRLSLYPKAVTSPLQFSQLRRTRHETRERERKILEVDFLFWCRSIARARVVCFGETRVELNI